MSTMEWLRRQIGGLVELTVRRVDADHPPYRSAHEAYGVLIEEMDESMQEIEHLADCVDRMRVDLKHGGADEAEFKLALRDAESACC